MSRRKYIPWITDEERKGMELLRSDLIRQAGRTTDTDERAKLENHISTIGRELLWDSENWTGQRKVR